MQIGEFASDYIEVRRDYLDWTPTYNGKTDSESDSPTAAGDRHGVPDVEVTHAHSQNGVAMQQPNGKTVNGNGSLAPISEKAETRSVSS